MSWMVQLQKVLGEAGGEAQWLPHSLQKELTCQQLDVRLLASRNVRQILFCFVFFKKGNGKESFRDLWKGEAVEAESL